MILIPKKKIKGLFLFHFKIRVLQNESKRLIKKAMEKNLLFHTNCSFVARAWHMPKDLVLKTIMATSLMLM